MKIRLPNSPDRYDREDQDRLRRALEAAFESNKLDILGGGTGPLSILSGGAAFALGIGVLNWSSADFGLTETPTGQLNVIISANISRVGHVHDAADVTTGVFARARLPSTLAYEDEANTFTLLQTFNAGLSIPDGVSITFAANVTGGGLAMGNKDITNVNNVQIGDPGPNEGISWAGGNLWKIYESPDDLTTNTGGNLQFAQNTTRRFTLYTDGSAQLVTGPLLVGTDPGGTEALRVGGAAHLNLSGTVTYPTPGTSKTGVALYFERPTTASDSSGIGWGGQSATDETVQAGIFVQSDGAFGTKMRFATTNLYATGAQARWQISTLGHFLAEVDNTIDIGASAATRPRTLYLGTSALIGTIASGGLRAYYGASDGVTTASDVRASSTNNLILSSAAGGDMFLNFDHGNLIRISGTGVRFETDNSIDIGATGANRPRNIYAANSLYVEANTDGVPVLLTHLSNVAANTAGVIGQRARTGPAAVAQDDVLVGLYGRGYQSGGAYGANVAAIRFLAAEAFTATNQGSYIDFATTSIGAIARTTRWIMNAPGHLIAGADNTYDIGATAASRPRTGYFGTSVVIGTDPTGGSLLRVGGGLTLKDAGALNFSATASGIHTGIEIGRIDGTASSPFMDWHSGATAVDYDVRFQATGGSGVSGGGTMQVTAASVTFSNNVTINTPGFLIMGLAASKIQPGSTSFSLRNNADTADNLILTDAGLATFRNNVAITSAAAAALDFFVDRPAGFTGGMNFRTAGVGRWGIYVTEVAEGGADSGSNFRLRARTDAGVFLDDPITIVRAAGGTIAFSRPLTFTPAGSKIIPGVTSISLRNAADNADNLFVADNGSITIRNALGATGGVTVAAGNTAKVLIDGPDGTLASGEIGLAENVGELWMGARSFIRLLMDDDNTGTGGVMVLKGIQGSQTTLWTFDINGALLASTAATKIIPGATSIAFRNNADNASNLLITDAGIATLRNDLIIGTLGQFDSTDAPLDGHILFYHGGATNKWQAESFQLIYNAGDAQVAVNADSTSVQYLYLDPGAGADSPVGAPPVPVLKLFPYHKGVTVVAYASTGPDIEYHDGASFPADFRHIIYEYSLDNFGTAAKALATASGDKVNHGRLTSGTIYYYRARAVDRAGNASANSTVVSFTATANSDTSNFGIILATEIAVDRLAAISANIGIITAGQLRNTGNTAGVNLGGAGGIPGTWTSGINFEAAAGSGSMTRYINFTATGANPFIKHELLSLNADGTAVFSGVARDANSKFVIDFPNVLLTVTDNQGSPAIRSKIGKIGAGTTDYGMQVFADNGNKIVELSGAAMFLQDSAATPTRGINIKGTKPASWTDYIDFTASGVSIIANLGALQLLADGTFVLNQTTNSGTAQVGGSRTVTGGNNWIFNTSIVPQSSPTVFSFVLINPALNSGAGTFSDFITLEVTTGIISTTVTNLYNARVKQATIVGGTVTTQYGLYIDSQTVGGTNYALYTNTGRVHFGDHIEFATAVGKIIPGATSIALRNNADSADNLLIANAGDATFRTKITMPGPLVLTTAASKIVPGATSLSLRNNADSADNLILVDAGDATFRTKVTLPGPLVLTTAASKIVPGATSIALRNNADNANNLLIVDAGDATFRTFIDMNEMTAPATPAANTTRDYAKDVGAVSTRFWKDDAGVEHPHNLTLIDTQTYTASGTWTKPSGAVLVLVEVIGGGGGGGGGRGGAVNTARNGGGGGGGGARTQRWWKASELGATETFVVGGGGSAGTGGSAADGTDGGNGGDSSFGTTAIQWAFGGGGGYRGVAVTNGGTGGSGGGSMSAGLVGGTTTQLGGAPRSSVAGDGEGYGGASADGGGAHGRPAVWGGASGGAGAAWSGGVGAYSGGGGGGGGDVTSANVQHGGGDGGGTGAGIIQGANNGGAAGGTAGNPGANGDSKFSGKGGGGGGGNSNSAGPNGGAGGAGGTAGGGGGGGGGGTTVGAGGAGGAGGRGEVRVYTYA